MYSYAQATLLGNLGKDPEMRFTANGTPVTRFSLAVNRRERDQERTDWWQVIAWGKLAENCNQFLKKGKSALVAGTPGLRTWEKTDGTLGHVLEITAQKVVFLNDGKDDSDEPFPDTDLNI